MTRTAILPCAAAALVTVLTSCCAALAFELVIQVAAEAAGAAWVFGFTQKAPLGVGVGVGVGVVTVPVHVTPLSLNVVGTALDPLQEPLNPKLVTHPLRGRRSRTGSRPRRWRRSG